MVNAKRILNVTVTQIPDTDGDTSYLGEYSDRRTNQFSIDRQHSKGCAVVSKDANDAYALLDRAIERLQVQFDDLSIPYGTPRYQALDEAIDILNDAREDSTACDCGESGDMSRGEYRYFNPSFNYSEEIAMLEAGKESPISADEIRKYVAQDYARMEGYNRDQWAFVGVRAEAEININSTIQTIRSAGLWGIESDSDASYFKEVEGEELHDLRATLTTLGFSKRAISTAFKEVDHQTV